MRRLEGLPKKKKKKKGPREPVNSFFFLFAWVLLNWFELRGSKITSSLPGSGSDTAGAASRDAS